MGKGRIPPNIPGFSIPFTKDEVVLNGDTDFNSIQDAVNAAAQGDVISVGPGTFNESVTVGVTELAIIGSGEGTIVDGGTIGHAFDVTANNVVIDQLTAQTTAGQGNNYDGINVSGRGVKLRHLKIADADRYGILVSKSDTRVFDAQVDAADGVGIRQSGGNNNLYHALWLLSGIGSHGFQLHSNASDSIVMGVMAQDVGAGGTGGGVVVSGPRNTVGLVHIDGTQQNGIAVTDNDNEVFGGVARNAGNNDLDISGDGNDVWALRHSSFSDSGSENRINGKYTSPPTQDLGGANGSISPTDADLHHYNLLVDAGGSAVNLQGIDNIATRGTKVTIWHTGGENVTLEHNNGSASNPLLNSSEQNETLDANDEMVQYEYDGTNWRQTVSNVT